MATSLHAKAGRLPSGVSERKPSVNRRSKQSRTVGEVARTSAGAACATEVNSVAGPVAVTLRLTPRPMGQPRSGRKRCLMLELHASKWRPCSSEGRGCWQQHLLTRLLTPLYGPREGTTPASRLPGLLEIPRPYRYLPGTASKPRSPSDGA